MIDMEWIGAGLSAAALVVLVGPFTLARWATKRRHREQFAATGAPVFDLPSARDTERDPDQAVPAWRDSETQVNPRVILDTDTGEEVRVDADGVPMSPADIAARTAPTTFTVDTARLAEVLQLEETGEYVMNPATWAEIGAAEAFMRDPLGSSVLPPIPLVDDAGNPALTDAFWSLVDAGRLTTDWQDEDSAFRFWDRDSELAGVN